MGGGANPLYSWSVHQQKAWLKRLMGVVSNTYLLAFTRLWEGRLGDLSSSMLLQHISVWRDERGGTRRLPCWCLQSLDAWQAEQQVNCSWSRKSGVEEAGVGRWLPSSEITVVALSHFLTWPPLSLWACWRTVPFTCRVTLNQTWVGGFVQAQKQVAYMQQHFQDPFLFVYFSISFPLSASHTFRKVVTKSEFLFFKLFSDISCSCNLGLLISWFFFIFLFCPFYF